jgi:hypothetical protein
MADTQRVSLPRMDLRLLRYFVAVPDLFPFLSQSVA